jgi:hypothetical protein
MRNGETTLRHLLAPVQDVLDDPATTEVVVQRPGEVGIEQYGEWSWRHVEGSISRGWTRSASWPARYCRSPSIRHTRSA